MNIRELQNKRERVYHWLMVVIGAVLWVVIAKLVGDYWEHPKFGGRFICTLDTLSHS